MGFVGFKNLGWAETCQKQAFRYNIHVQHLAAYDTMIMFHIWLYKGEYSSSLRQDSGFHILRISAVSVH